MQLHHPLSKRRSVILNETPVARLQMWKPARAFSVTIAYSTVDGTVESLDRPLTRLEALSGRYWTMYEVDAAHQSTRVEETVPSRDDSFLFTVDATIGWRVADATKVIRERAGDGVEAAVVDYVRPRMRQISRQYDIEDFAPVENGINRLLVSGPVTLDKLGIVIESVSAHVSHDNDTKRFLRERKEIQRQITLGQDSHVLNTQEQQQAQELEKLRLAAVAAGVQGEFGLITMFLRHHPDQSLQVLQMLHARQVELEQSQQARFASSAAVFEKMLENDLIQDVDIEPLRDATVANLLAMATSTAAPQATGHAVLPGTPQVPVATQVTGATPELAPAPPPARYDDEGASQSTGSSGVTGWRKRRTSPDHGA